MKWKSLKFCLEAASKSKIDNLELGKNIHFFLTWYEMIKNFFQIFYSVISAIEGFIQMPQYLHGTEDFSITITMRPYSYPKHYSVRNWQLHFTIVNDLPFGNAALN